MCGELNTNNATGGDIWAQSKNSAVPPGLSFQTLCVELMKKIYILIPALILLSACSSTQKAWSTFRPTEYAYVMTNGIDPEPLLKENKVNYYCENVAYTSDNLNKACYVEKTLAQRTNEFTHSLTNTPKAMAQDIFVIGKVTIQAIAVLFQGGTSF